MLGVGLHS